MMTTTFACADEVMASGSAAGTVTGVAQLSFSGGEFTATTKGGVGYFSGPNRLGTFSLTTSAAASVSGAFRLTLALTPGRSATFTGTVSSAAGQRAVWIHFAKPSVKLTFDTGAENGTLTISLADVIVQSGHTASLVGVLMGFQERDTPCPLTFTAAMAKPFLLWPATQKMTPIAIRAVASDGKPCGLSCRITSVESNEPQSQSGDWQITGDLTLNVLSDRLSTGYGRIYTAAVQCT